jgi:hypothetical protein
MLLTENLVEQLQSYETQRDEVCTLLEQAQSDLDDAIAKQKISGEYADPVWFAKTKGVIREKTNELHSINRQIKAIKMNLNRSNPRAAYFQQAARNIVDDDTYKQIEELANSWLNAKIG